MTNHLLAQAPIWDSNISYLPPAIVTPTRLHVMRYARNGFVPCAAWETLQSVSANFVPSGCPKQLFSGSVAIGGNVPNSTSGERARFRFTGHTGPYLSYLYARVLVGQVTSGTAPDPYVRLKVTNQNGSTTYDQQDYHYGAAAYSNDKPNTWSQADIILTGVPADTDIFGTFYDEDYGRLLAASVYEVSLVPTGSNGYLEPQSVALGESIYSGRRQTQMTIANNMWKRGAAHLASWSTSRDTGDDNWPYQITSTSDHNVIDNSTSVTATSSGLYADTRYCNTESTTVVPCRFAVFARASTFDGDPVDGTVKLKDSGGSTLATITVNGDTGAWYQTTVNLPASLAKYDVTAAASSGVEHQAYVYAASLYQYKA